MSEIKFENKVYGKDEITINEMEGTIVAPSDLGVMGTQTIKPFPKVIGVLRHEATLTNFNVYKKIGWFKRFMLKTCFGLKYIKVN